MIAFCIKQLIMENYPKQVLRYKKLSCLSSFYLELDYIEKRNFGGCVSVCVYGNVPFWPTVYTVPLSYPVSIEDYCITKYLSVYTMPFS